MQGHTYKPIARPAKRTNNSVTQVAPQRHTRDFLGCNYGQCRVAAENTALRQPRFAKSGAPVTIASAAHKCWPVSGPILGIDSSCILQGAVMTFLAYRPSPACSWCETLLMYQCQAQHTPARTHRLFQVIQKHTIYTHCIQSCKPVPSRIH